MFSQLALQELSPTQWELTVSGAVVKLICVLREYRPHLTYGASVRPENAVTDTQRATGRKVCGDLSETTAFKSNAVKHERKSQYAWSAFSA